MVQNGHLRWIEKSLKTFLHLYPVLIHSPTIQCHPEEFPFESGFSQVFFFPDVFSWSFFLAAVTFSLLISDLHIT